VHPHPREHRRGDHSAEQCVRGHRESTNRVLVHSRKFPPEAEIFGDCPRLAPGQVPQPLLQKAHLVAPT
jgi:hypothetical protein